MDEQKESKDSVRFTPQSLFDDPQFVGLVEYSIQRCAGKRHQMKDLAQEMTKLFNPHHKGVILATLYAYMAFMYRDYLSQEDDLKEAIENSSKDIN